ncbi:MAG TPA: prolyl oligopeptidase family serine peptidase [Herpetosiphonaceae bacterium]
MTADRSATSAERPGVYQPGLRDMLTLDQPQEIRVSPNGSRVAIKVRTTSWNANRYDTLCYIHDLDSGTTRPLTRTGCVSQMEWVDDHTLAVLKQGPKDDDTAQIWLYEGLLGDGCVITEHEPGVEWFKPFADGVIFLARHPERKENQKRKDRFGTFVHFEQEVSTSALYYVGLPELREHELQVRTTTEEQAKKLVRPQIEVSKLLPEILSIREVIDSPADDALYLNCWKRDDLVSYRDTSSYQIRLHPRAALAEYIRRESAKNDKKSEDEAESSAGDDAQEDVAYLGAITRLQLPRGASVAAVSPDGSRLLVGHQGRDERMYTHRDLWQIDVTAALAACDSADCLAAMQNISASLDRLFMEQYWTERGIFASYVDGTCVRIAHLSAEQVTPLEMEGIFPVLDFHANQAGQIALIGANARTLPEAYLATPTADESQWQVRQLSDFGAAAKDWDWGTVETIRWTSTDGTEIEGVLRKPSNFDPHKKYPLVFVVHGGPMWFSAAYLLTGYERSYYPAVQLTHKDVLVLSPNYRGSVGYGQAFAELNVNNLGVGDLWDVESAIDYLAEQGFVDTDNVGCMGWSQGGYISAFVGLHSTRFRAVSVGAGVSDWYTYHISNDVPHFTLDYLSGSPFRDRDLYIKTAPMSNIAQARTPTLIQHGEDDQRVPLSNALELYRGLREMQVPAELFVYPGMGHPITKPRENHAVLHQNLTWFSHYLLGEELELE